MNALEGVTVVEFGSYAAGPAIGKYLGNFGAHVIHVESMKRPDGFRLQYPPYKDHSVGLNRSGCFAIFNDSKRGVTIDLKHSGGIELVYRLIERTDIAIENMRPGVMTKLGLDYPALAARNPRLVMLSTSNLGQTGPRATHPGFGTQLSSLSGFTELIGAPDGPPHPLYGPYIDLVAVAYGGAAVLAALDRRRRTGEGAFIDLAQYETGLQFVAPPLLDYAVNGVVAQRKGNRDDVAVPHGCYPCAADRWIVISCWDDEEWRRLAALVDAGAAAPVIPVTDDARFSTVSGRRAHESALNERLAEWARGQDAGRLTARLRDARVHTAVVNTMRDLYEDPQLAARDIWQRHDHPEIGPLNYRMISYRLSETPGRVHSAAPCLGQHNEEVFRSWFGLSADEYDILSADGVFS